MARVLVLEPHLYVRDSFVAVCETWGHEVVATEDDQDAIAIVAGFRPDIVLLDLGLPGALGCAEVVQRIRAREGGRVFIIVLTGWAPAGAGQKVLRAGADAFFLKPPNLDRLRTTIERAMHKMTMRGAS